LGVVTPGEMLAGFANPITLMIGGLFVVGAGLTSTGVAEWLGRRLGKIAGTSEVRLLVVTMLAAALLSAFMSSTGTVAVLLPVVSTLAHQARVSTSRLLMPMAFASLLGGLLTLVGTPPNLVVSDQLQANGHEPFHFFSFTGPGLTLLLLGVGYMVLVGRRWLPGEEGVAASVRSHELTNELARNYGLLEHLHFYRIPPWSSLAWKLLADANLRARFGVTVVGVRRPGEEGGEEAIPVLPRTLFRPGDTLLVQADADAAQRMAQEFSLELAEPRAGLPLGGDESLAELVLPRSSALVGKTLLESRFRDTYRATVLAIRRAGQEGHEPTDLVLRGGGPLQAGDMLLVKGRIKHLKRLPEEHRNFVVVTAARTPEEVRLDNSGAWIALLVTGGMLALMSFGLVPNATAVLLAAAAMVLFRCVPPAEVYRSVNWESVVLVAAILPMATALEKTGGLRSMVDGLLGVLGEQGPYILLGVLFLLTSSCSLVMSNTATAVLVAPVAFQVAVGLHLSPRPFLMTVAIAASTAFATPIASPVNTLVMNPGGYRFRDYVVVGLSLQLVLMVATLILVPCLFPFLSFRSPQ
ncbi:MAG: SLC13 family permease, partial [Myxococcales bacterium]|nr:SLC13 family permease [Polyangiaceae bacterium]MDW8249106.1 SLC13 family permease [Myxococcales bacterium]